MKKYIGTKTVQAEPMTKGQAYDAGLLRVGTLPASERELPGYKVAYDNGYESWSPADVFEAAYKVAETPLDCVNIEVADLMARADKLGQFIFNQNDGNDFQALEIGTRAFLIAQFHIMGAYLNLLCLRQSCMEGNVKCRPYGLSFEQILPLLKEGYVIRRYEWREQRLMVFKQVPARITSEIIPRMQSLPEEAKRLVLDSGDYIDYVSQCLIFNSKTGRADSWTPSISDIFASDWELVVEP